MCVKILLFWYKTLLNCLKWCFFSPHPTYYQQKKSLASVFSSTIKRVCSPKNENSVVILSPICRSKPVRPHLPNTNENIFDEFWELSDPPIDSYVITTIRNVVRTSVNNPWDIRGSLYEDKRIGFVCKENNNSIIYSTILLPELPSSFILESTPEST